ncbi:hypothetical protein [Candidatus Uabimicrobium sp. HlEnr_7]|uniref:hypothetical protein n=1 Tax=Candidatus Uabimicrobium helgolandensis TaxID=3095367 RepID=UPI00355674BA
MRKKILLVVTIFFLGFFAIEALLRIVKTQLSTKTAQKTSSAFVFHPHYIITLKKNHQKEFVHNNINGGKVITWKTNAHGFRGKELQKNPYRRIVVYGDSNIQARFSSLKDTFTQQLQTLLSNNQQQIEIINAGIVGAGPDQYLLRLQEQYQLLQQHLTIFAVFADNDLGDILRNRLFFIEKDTLKKTSFPVISDEKLTTYRSIIQRSQSNFLTIRTIDKIIKKYSDSSQKIIQTLQVYCKQDYELYLQKKPRKVLHINDYYDIDIALNPKQASAILKIKLLEKILYRAQNFCHNRNSKFLVIILPSVIDLTKNGRWSYADLKKVSPTYKSNNISQAIENVCKNIKIPYINFFKAMSKNNPSTLFFIRDGHWNNAGQKLAAEQTKSYINKKNWLK